MKYICNNSFLNCGCRWKWRIILDQTTSKSSRAVCSTALYTWWKNRCSLKKCKPRNDGVSRIYGHTLDSIFFLEKLTLSWLSRASGAGANHGSEYFFSKYAVFSFTLSRKRLGFILRFSTVYFGDVPREITKAREILEETYLQRWSFRLSAHKENWKPFENFWNASAQETRDNVSFPDKELWICDANKPLAMNH